MKHPYFLTPVGLLLFCGIILALFISPAVATDRYYRDKTVLSPNGLLRIEAKSPENAGERPQPFARDFVYVLYDTKTDAVLWKRLQPEEESSPVAIYLHDSTWVVIRTGFDDLIVLEPLTGRTVLEVDIIEHIPEEERTLFVHDSSGGPMWAGQSRWNYFKHDDHLFFILRTWWGRRIILDLTDRRLVDKTPPSLKKACDEVDRTLTLNTLNGAAKRIKQAIRQPRNKRDPLVSKVRLAIYTAGVMNLKEAVPHLRELEQCELQGDSGLNYASRTVVQDGEINPYNLLEMTVRRWAHHALRKLGERPRPLPCIRLFYDQGDQRGVRVPVPILPEPRENRAGLVQVKGTPRKVLDAIGAPDFVFSWSRQWIYDMDGEEPFTLHIFWSKANRVERMERIAPPGWKRDDRRASRLFDPMFPIF